MAERIQRKRTKGWRMPKGAVYVGRPTCWGNPIDPTNTIGCENPADAAAMYRDLMEHGDTVPYPHRGQTAALMEYRKCALEFADELAGLDLACWCPLDQPCHADVLLEIANGDARG